MSQPFNELVPSPWHSFSFPAAEQTYLNSFLDLPSSNVTLKYKSHLKQKQYLSIRKDAISKMRRTAKKYAWTDNVLHLAIWYLDKIFTKISAVSEVHTLSTFCLIFAAKFIDEGFKGHILEKDLSNKISGNYRKDEQYILEWLDYNLSWTSAYDIVSAMINIGIVFNDEGCKGKINKRFDWFHFEKMLLNIVNMFIESKHYLELTQNEIAITLVMICRDKVGLSRINNSLIKLYGLGNYKYNYEKCFKKLSKLFKESSRKDKNVLEERDSNGSEVTNDDSNRSSLDQAAETEGRNSALLKELKGGQ